MKNRMLHPPADTEIEYREEVFAVLDRFHEKLDAEFVLEEFPEDTPFQLLYPFTAQAVNASTESMYNTRMKFNLTMSDYAEAGERAVFKE